MDTNRPDCVRAGEGRATSPAQAGSRALGAQVSARQRYELMSLTMLAREFQSGRDLSCGPPRLKLRASIRSASLHHILVIPSEVEESLTVSE